MSDKKINKKYQTLFWADQKKSGITLSPKEKKLLKHLEDEMNIRGLPQG